ncbi:AraC family transcriptional regulator [Acidovorax sp. CCYZU-2555]|uniref:helix-turn-helix transcriptional regulator n=1 Tax=Acidovorax sp. CCYZU-2555 TaxID=2835042 RepID=UPI001BCF2768|nr:AraC family transcriptional regulator [Acidovorax sp. CCYZU-2555]MBS7780887.1 AraC family transcriptional regulator [Acidovorax sp. CCYZU-2555]
MQALSQFWRDPAMPYAESRRACDSQACYKPHSHPTFSIGAVDRGRSCFSGAGDRPVTLQEGTLVLVPAGRVHACNPEPGGAWSYQMLHLDAAWLQAVRAEYAGDANDSAPIRIVAAPAVYARFCGLNTLLFSAADVEDKEAALIEFIGECDTGQGLRVDSGASAMSRSQALLPVLDFLCKDAAHDTDLADLARLAGMSRFQLIRAFRAATGMTPHAWQLNRRINLARDGLRAGEGLADIAYRLGFADQAHFQRVFKAHAGVTPGRFRA